MATAANMVTPVQAMVNSLVENNEQQDVFVRMSKDVSNIASMIEKNMDRGLDRFLAEQEKLFNSYLSKTIRVDMDRKADEKKQFADMIDSISKLREKKESGTALTTKEMKTLLDDDRKRMSAMKGGSMMFNPMGVISEKMDKIALSGLEKVTRKIGMDTASAVLKVKKDEILMRQAERADIVKGVIARTEQAPDVETAARNEQTPEVETADDGRISTDILKHVSKISEEVPRISENIVDGITAYLKKQEGEAWASRQKDRMPKVEVSKMVEKRDEEGRKQVVEKTGGGLFDMFKNLKSGFDMLKTSFATVKGAMDIFSKGIGNVVGKGGLLSKGLGALGSAGSIGSAMTGGLGWSGLMGSSMGGIGTAGAGAVATSAGLALGTAALGGAAGYGINKLGNKLMPGDVEGQVTGKRDFNDLLTDMVVNTNPLAMIAKHTGLMDGILASNKDIADAQKRNLREATEQNSILKTMKEKGESSSRRQDVLQRASVYTDIGITDEKEQKRLSALSEKDFEKEIEDKYASKWIGGGKAKDALATYRQSRMKSKIREKDIARRGGNAGVMPGTSVPVPENSDVSHIPEVEVQKNIPEIPSDEPDVAAVSAKAVQDEAAMNNIRIQREMLAEMRRTNEMSRQMLEKEPVQMTTIIPGTVFPGAASPAYGTPFSLGGR